MSSIERSVQSSYPNTTNTHQHQHQHQHQHPHRRPPDVEEALSSMLWTPYERTPTDTSSEEDDDERLNRRLCRSQTFQTAQPIATPIGSSYFGDDIEGGVAASPATFVPFPTPTRSAVSPPSNCIDQSLRYPSVAAITSAGGMATNYHHHHHKNYDSSVGNYRFSYPYYSPIPSLNKWWSAAAASSSSPSTGETAAACASPQPAVPRDANNSSTNTETTTTDKEPPSYESLYAKNTTTGQKAANALRPVLHTLKATISGARHKHQHQQQQQQQDEQQQQHIEATANQEMLIRTTTERLVHSFTDDFIAEIHQQHVAYHPENDQSAQESDVQANARSQQNEETNNNNNTNCTLTMDHQMNNNCNGEAMRNSEQVNQLTDTLVNSRTTPHHQESESTESGEQSSTKTREPNKVLSRDKTTNTESSSAKRERRRQTVHSTTARSPAFIVASSFNASGGVYCSPSNRNSRHSGEIVVCNKFEPELVTPNNKCLAELERLYEEFRLSESLRELQRNSLNIHNNNNSSIGVVDFTDNMRLNVPAAASVAVAVATADSAASESKQPKSCATTTSSVFLTTTNSVTTNCNVSKSGKSVDTTTTSNPCQRQPSLTIQVNNNNNNNNNNTSDINTKTCETQVDLLLNQSIVNNNGVSVVNCNYAPSVNSVSVNSSSSSSRSNLSSVPNRFSVSDTTKSRSDPKNDVNCNEVVAPAAAVPQLPPTTQASDSESVSVISIKPPLSQQIDPKTQTIPTRSSPSTTTRTFTSTECQTDDIHTVEMRSPRRHDPISQPGGHPAVTATSREQRRRERRERRHQVTSGGPPPPPASAHSNHRRHNDRHSMPAGMLAPPLPHHPHHPQLHPPTNLTHLHPHPHPHPPPPPHHMHHVMAPPTATMPAAMSAMLRPMLPDILNSHFPPPYSALPPTGPPGAGGPGGGGLLMSPAPPQTTPQQTVIPGHTTLLTPVISTLPIPGATPIMGDGRFTLPLPIMRRSPSERSGKGCCGQWFAGPPLRALIAVVALGGVACALGGAALGATGLAGTPSSHLTAALLMIGVGVVLVTVSGAAWRMTAPGGPPCLGLGSSVDLGRCGRRPCSRGGGAPHGLLYPEFQHRPPPPSYQASMQEYRLRLLLLDRDRQNGVIRGNSPPPTYRSHAGSLLRAPLTTTIRGGGCGSSSLGGSEYSLPPSYRSRHTGTPGTVSSERSIETAPSGRLLANEDIPEPLSAEQLPDYSSIQLHRCSTPTHGNTPKMMTPHTTAISTAATTTDTTMTTTTTTHQLNATSALPSTTTAAIIEVERNQRNCNSNKEKLNPRVFGIKDNLTLDNGSGNGMGGKDLVTIVTISQGDSQVSNETQRKPDAAAGEQIEILAHL